MQIELNSFNYPALITCAALIVYLGTLLNVGRNRLKHKIFPPNTLGNPEFERALRVQQNMTEQLVLFIPSLWMFTFFVSSFWASILGIVWIIGRIVFAITYCIAAEKRTPGFAIGFLANFILLTGSIVGIVLQII